MFFSYFCLFACSISVADAIEPKINDSTIRPEVKKTALHSYQHAIQQDLTDTSIVTIIDLELSSTKKRLWVIDVKTGKTLFYEQVAHGRNSDTDNDTFVDKGGLSNERKSKKSSIGVYLTAETYHSSKFKGTSLKLDGLEKEFNDNARKRAIVMHPANYADVKEGQRVGRSHGCPALDPDISDSLIDTIKDGTLLIQYYPDEQWLKKSDFVNK